MYISINIEMIPTKDPQNEQWDSFEHAATYSCARSILEKKAVTTTEETSSKATTTIEYECRLFC